MLPKILIVDDQPANLAALRAVLAKVEAAIVETTQGNEAVVLCLEQDFAVILLDVNMPEMDGYEVAQLLREDELTRKTPIIFVTASHMDENQQLRGYETGAVDYITKPINERILLSKVLIFLELYGYRRRQELQTQLLNEQNKRLEQEIYRRQQAEAELHKQNRQLEEMVIELQKARDQAMQVTAAKSSFLATMSHEIRTPMNGVLGMTHLLAETPLNTKQKLYIDTIKNSGETLLAIINDILDFSKIEANRIVLETIPFDLEKVLKNTIKVFSDTGKNKGIGPYLQLFPDTPRTVVGDPNRLRQILFNLIGNAVKFTETGIVALFVRPVQETDDTINLKFFMDDTGIGIPPDKLCTLFEPFTQADSSTTRRYGGTGLGLAITAKLITLIGGTLEILSTVGVGSSFRFEIPLAKAVALQSAAETESNQTVTPAGLWLPLNEQDSFVGKHLLVVDDDATNRLLLTEILHGLAFASVTEACNGAEALEKFRANHYDVILMDCQMPVMDGYEATRKIRQLETDGEKPGHVGIIALTAGTLSQDRALCYAAGMDEFLSKPFEPTQLLKILRHWSTNRLPAADHTPTAMPTEPTTPPPSAPALLNLQGFADLCRMLSEDKLKTIVRAFLHELPGKLDALHHSIAQNNAEELHRKAHILKGNCGMIQATAMAALCQQLVDLGRAGDTQNAAVVFQRLTEKSTESIAAFEELLDI